MAPKLYYWPRSSATRVQWALEELGIAYDKVRLERESQFHRSPEFLAINPNGKIPAMEDDGAKLFESLAIVLHLGDKYGVERGLWPAPGTPARGEAFAWAIWAGIQLNYWIFEYLRAQAPEAKAGWDQHLAILEGRLADRPYVVGDAFTLVDVTVASYVGLAPSVAKLPLDGTPRVADWYGRCRARPAWARVIAEK
jgi:glutathione S-transferase